MNTIDALRITVDDAGRRRDVTLQLRDERVTVGDVAAALGAGSFVLDGGPITPGTAAVASPLQHGSVLVLEPSSPAAAPAVAHLRWTGGAHAGVTTALAPGRHVIGRAPGLSCRRVETDVAPYHCVVDVDAVGGATFTPLVPMSPATNGRRWRIGSAVAEFVPERPRDRVPLPTGRRRPGDWSSPVARPPRPPLPSDAAPVRRPDAPSSTSMAATGGMIGALATVLASVVAAVALHEPALLILGGVGALGTVVTGLVYRRRRSRQAKRGRRRTAAALAQFDAALTEQRRVAVLARWARAVELPEAIARAEGRDARLWERRPAHDDHLVVVLGVGTVPWTPILEGAGPTGAAAEAVLARHHCLDDVPVVVSLRPGTVLGLVGDLGAARALARSLLIQAAVTSGPADIAIRVFTETAPAWNWARWLPHVVIPDEVLDSRPSIVVIDDPALLTARASTARSAVGGAFGPAAAVVLAPTAVGLPAACTHIVAVDQHAMASLRELTTGVVIAPIVGAGAAIETVTGAARALAGLDDPDLIVPGGDAPHAVAFADLVGTGLRDDEALVQKWRAAGDDPGLRATIGVGAGGAVEIDLVRDGPHALVAGTTGAGKSELLRALIAGLAAGAGPQRLSFVLIDYKGGSAFDACADLPHVAAVVTDLDDRLAARALCSFEAELRRREAIFRVVGAADIVDHGRRVASDDVLPRLVLVVDELAGLVADLPDFVGALVSIAQRGRSLGVHLVLATQRPAGVVSDDIRANTNLRIALRMQDRADSTDVIGTADAAHLPRDRPGRALVRIGADPPFAVQVAHAGAPAPEARQPPVVVIEEGVAPLATSESRTSALAEFVATATRAAALIGAPASRRPWLDPLPEHLALEDLPAGAVALVDDPDAQAQRPVGWRRNDGHLLCFGARDSGAALALVSLTLTAARAASPSQLHIYAVDMGAGALSPLSELGHCGAVVTAAEPERLARLVRRLHARVSAARTDAVAAPEIVVVVDGLPAWRDAFDHPGGFELLDALDRVLIDGPTAGVHVAATVDRPGALPPSITAGVKQRWVFALPDPADARSLGVAPTDRLPPGRAIDVASGLELQVATAAGVEIDAGEPRDAGGPAPIASLPATVAERSLPPADLSRRPWSVPVGVRDDDLEPAALTLHEADHVLVTGRSRTGRSTALVLLAERLRAANPGLALATVTPRPSPLRDVPATLAVTDRLRLPALAELIRAEAPLVIVVDDADLVDDDGTLAALLALGRDGLHVIAAGRPDVLRPAYGHWTAAVRRSRLGVLLQPDPDLDGDLLGTVLPRRRTIASLPGRGYLVTDGHPQVVQLARPAIMDQ